MGFKTNKKLENMTRKDKTLKRISIFLALTLLSTGLIFAQAPGQPGPPSPPTDKQIEEMVEELDKELDLSDVQNEQVSELYFDHFDKVEDLMKSSQRPSRTQMEALRSKFEEGVKALLDEKQQKLYTAYLEEQEKQRSNQRTQGGERGQGGQRPPS